MKLAILFLSCVATLGGFTLVQAADPVTPAAPATQPASPINKKCPVTGEDVDSKITWEYQGRVIGFCCMDCVEPFKKNPEKYMKDLK